MEPVGDEPFGLKPLGSDPAIDGERDKDDGCRKQSNRRRGAEQFGRLWVGLDEIAPAVPLPAGVGEVEPRDAEEARERETTTEDDYAELAEGHSGEGFRLVGVNVFVDLHFESHGYASPVTFFDSFVAENKTKMSTTGATKNMPKFSPMKSPRSLSPGSMLSAAHDPISAW